MPAIFRQPAQPLILRERVQLSLLRLGQVGDPPHPLALGREELVGHREEAAGPAAARDQGGGDVEAVQDEVAIFVADLAAAHIGADQRRHPGLREVARNGRRSASHIRPASPGRPDCPSGSRPRASRRRFGPSPRGPAPPCPPERPPRRAWPPPRRQQQEGRRLHHPIAARSAGSSPVQLAGPSSSLPLMKKVGRAVDSRLVALALDRRRPSRARPDRRGRTGSATTAFRAGGRIRRARRRGRRSPPIRAAPWC